MTKSYVKDPNGKYRLVEKETQEPQPLTLEKVDVRLKVLEKMLLGDRA